MLLDSLVRIIAPEYCFSCRKIGKYMCWLCATKLVFHTDFYTKPPGLDGHISFFAYQGPFKNTLRGAKYFSIRKALNEICDHIPWEAFDKTLNETFPDRQNFVLVPVPLHPKKLKERGFNQTEVIAQEFKKHIHIPIQTQCLYRKKYTLQQARLTSLERRTNITGAFDIRHPEKLTNKTIIIVDDVWTTGSTIREIAHVLESVNVRGIYALTLAR